MVGTASLGRLYGPSLALIVEYIDQHKHQFGVEPICAVLTGMGVKIAPSTYYARKSRPPAPRAVRDEVVTAKLQEVHARNYGVYGIRKMYAALARVGGVDGTPVVRCTVQRLMKATGLKGVSRRKTPRTTVAGKGIDTRADHVNRNFTASAPDQLWVADFTYVRTLSGWVYAAFILDVFSRRIVGWRLSRNMRTDLALDALHMAMWARQRAGHDLTGLIHHSDRGVQGGFNRSSQHLDVQVRSSDGGTGVRRQAQAVAGRPGDPGGNEVAGSPGRPSLEREPKRRFWVFVARGLSSVDAAVQCGVSPVVGARWFRQGGGMPPVSLAEPSGRYLSLSEREEIAILNAQGEGVREIGWRIGRDPSTISRELRRNTATRAGERHYRASVAQWKAERLA